MVRERKRDQKTHTVVKCTKFKLHLCCILSIISFLKNQPLYQVLLYRFFLEKQHFQKFISLLLSKSSDLIVWIISQFLAFFYLNQRNVYQQKTVWSLFSVFQFVVVKCVRNEVNKKRQKVVDAAQCVQKKEKKGKSKPLHTV